MASGKHPLISVVPETETTSDGVKSKIRKTIEYIRSTRYTEIVEANDETTSGPSGMVTSGGIPNTRDDGNKSVANSIGLLDSTPEVIDLEKQQFRESCQKLVEPYLVRMDQMSEKLKNDGNEIIEKAQKLEEKITKDKKLIREKLLEVFEAGKKNREKRDLMFKTLLDKF
ncbi:uncharacterized protein LOC129780088 [Toxorhynchites rutilus septentrionalis]|uniref:uncharacterized protein LOC129780088 n=1 Tax=Toxorhynchites rutilus septentrionalis TaxID=329112 RepID=UPI00247857BF|nr:uncharacterized protein LOC129780088 [Toxorhynchites rutilus septentrionalis]